MIGSRVYVEDLTHGVRESALEHFSEGDIAIKTEYGFVEFEDSRGVDDAVYELNAKELLGERVVVEPARGTGHGGGGHRDRYDRYDSGRCGDGRYNDNYRSNFRYGPPLRTEYRVIVENLSSCVSWQDLKDYMCQAGQVTYVDAHKHRRNEGVVEFASLSAMKNAIEKLDDTDLKGCRICLVEVRRSGRDRVGERDGRSGSSNTQSRSRRRSRSRRSPRSSPKSCSRCKSRGARSKSKTPVKSRSHSPSNKPRTILKSKSKLRSRTRSSSINCDDSRSRSGSISKSKSQSLSRSRSRSRLRSASAQNGNTSPSDRNNERRVD